MVRLRQIWGHGTVSQNTLVRSGESKQLAGQDMGRHFAVYRRMRWSLEIQRRWFCHAAVPNTSICVPRHSAKTQYIKIEHV